MRKKWSLAIVLMIVVVGAGFSLQFLASAQNDPIPLPETNAVRQNLTTTGEHHIVYLVNSGAHTELVNSIATVTGAQVVYSWDDILEQDSQHSIQALIVDSSAYDLVDREWLGQAYRNGMALATINLTYAQQVELRQGSSCALEKAQKLVNMFSSDFFYISAYIALTENQTDQAIVDAAHQVCKAEFEGLTGQVFAKGFAVQGELINEAWLNFFAEGLSGAIFRIEDTRQNFEHRSLPATPVSEFNN